VTNDQRQDEVSLHIKAKQLADLKRAMSDCGFFVQDVLVDDLLENALGIGLDLSFNTDNQVVKLVETFLF